MTGLLLCGYPGRMALEVEGLCSDAAWLGRFVILPIALGSGRTRGTGRMVLSPTERDGGELRARCAGAVAVDFSTPASALENLRFLVGAGFPTVMGTTGFDRGEAARIVGTSDVCAVVAPNMAAPIVLAQAALSHLAAKFPGALHGMRLSVRESHQAGKRDTSGTAIALSERMRGLGLALEDPIQSVRDPGEQLRLGVPAEHLAGHGWHWFVARDAQGTTELRLETRICGRRVYAEGALLAAEFLARKRASGERGRVYSMEDVLEGA